MGAVIGIIGAVIYFYGFVAVAQAHTRRVGILVFAQACYQIVFQGFYYIHSGGLIPAPRYANSELDRNCLQLCEEDQKNFDEPSDYECLRTRYSRSSSPNLLGTLVC